MQPWPKSPAAAGGRYPKNEISPVCASIPGDLRSVSTKSSMAAILFILLLARAFMSYLVFLLPSLVASGPGPVSDSLPDRPPVRYATAHVRRLENEAWLSRVRSRSSAHAQ